MVCIKGRATDIGLTRDVADTDGIVRTPLQKLEESFINAPPRALGAAIGPTLDNFQFLSIRRHKSLPVLSGRLHALHDWIGVQLDLSAAMTISPSNRFIHLLQRIGLIALPTLLLLIFVMHFRHLADFLTFHLQYTPRAPADVVPQLIAAGNRWPMLHEPHMIAYLSLPFFLLAAFALYSLGRQERPRASTVGLSITLTGVIYLGGLFGMWTAFFRGLGSVDPQYTDGAIATFAALTAPTGAFLLTTTLAKLAFVGLAVQALALLGTRVVPAWAPLLVAVGCSLFLAFWDLDNWMLVGSLCMLAGFVPMSKPMDPKGSGETEST